MKPLKKDFHEELAEKIIKQLESGTAPWIKPWEPGEIELPYNPVSGTRYRGANILALYGEPDPRWMTYKQASANGWQVKKGEKSTRVQYWKIYDERIKRDDNGQKVLKDGKPVMVKVMREFPTVFHASVFNASQIEGIPELENQKQPKHEWSDGLRAEEIIRHSGAEIKHKNGDRAFYSPINDEITMPEKGQFSKPHKYYETVFHELGHWTGHSSRLSRDLTGARGSDQYAKEELRAEISSFITAGELGLGHDPSQHYSYIKSWVKNIKEDAKEITRATADAEKISKFIMAFERDKELDKLLDIEPKEIVPELNLTAVDVSYIKFAHNLGYETINAFMIENEKGQYVADTEGKPMRFNTSSIAKEVIKQFKKENTILSYCTPKLHQEKNQEKLEISGLKSRTLKAGNRAVVIIEQDNSVYAFLAVNAKNDMADAVVTGKRWEGKTLKGAKRWANVQLEGHGRIEELLEIRDQPEALKAKGNVLDLEKNKKTLKNSRVSALSNKQAKENIAYQTGR
ncbi:MAG: conjugal transfer protein TraC [Flavobacteriaceae bacterium]|nr:MAG: conjugal transfer protein TraC [Flavobacteriaceae bacterium]